VLPGLSGWRNTVTEPTTIAVNPGHVPRGALIRLHAGGAFRRVLNVRSGERTHQGRPTVTLELLDLEGDGGASEVTRETRNKVEVALLTEYAARAAKEER
jgi:hypothetical protein